jgi:hypothetical protein
LKKEERKRIVNYTVHDERRQKSEKIEKPDSPLQSPVFEISDIGLVCWRIDRDVEFLNDAVIARNGSYLA